MIRKYGFMAAATALVFLNSLNLQAADFTIEAGETATTTQILGDGETGTVEEGGTISTVGVNEYGIDGGNKNTITNKSTIESTGSGGSGISVDDENKIFNSR
jgi:hypothetical protein